MVRGFGFYFIEGALWCYLERQSKTDIVLYLAYRDLSKKWTMAIRSWPAILSHFSVSLRKDLMI